MKTTEQFNDSLAPYIQSIKQSSSEATIRHRCLEFLQESLDVVLIPPSSPLQRGEHPSHLYERGVRGDFELEQRVFRGRVDAVLGRLVFEFKQDLAPSALSEAETQLRRYLSDLHQQYPEATYTGIACDGLRFYVYRASYQDNSEATLEPIGSLDLERASDPLQAFLWLDGLLAHFRQDRVAPTARSVVVALGASSPTFLHVSPVLLGLFRQVKDMPEVAVRYQEWQSYLSIVYGSAVGDDSLFVRHTYLSLVARLIARFFLEPGAMLTSLEDLGKTIDGEYFREQGIDNFIEDDFFTWLLKSPEIAAEALELARRLAYSLAVYDFGQARQDLLKSLYEELVDPETRHDLGEYYTPDWLAEYMLDTELGLSGNPEQSVFDPSCGSGTFLFTAIRLIVKARLGRGEDELDTLLQVLNQVMGMDVHPVAVTIARANYLLALGDLIKGPHPPVLLPVYLSNALVLPGSTAEREPLGGYPEPVHTVETSEPGVVFELPHSVVSSPEMLDWLFARLPNYIGGAEMRQQMQGQEEAIQEVLNSFHTYLVAPKPRTPIPEPLSGFAAEVMVGTARRLLQLYFEGKDHVWLFILKNIPASIYLAQRRFDLVVGNPPWLSMRYVRNPEYRRQVRSQILREYQLLSRQDTHLFTHMELAALFFARCADLYLNPPSSPSYQGGDTGGVIAMVMPRAVLTAEQHSRFTSFFFKGGSQVLKLEKVLDLEQVSPLFNVPACVLVARNKQQTHYPAPGLVFSGDVPSRNASWLEAGPMLERNVTTFDRQAGKLLPEGQAILQRPPSFYEDKFYQGATLVPRNMWFVRLRLGPLGYNPERPLLETDPEATRQAKAPWKDIHMSGNVEAQFLYVTLPSGDLMPFGYTRLRLIVLPLLREGDRLALVNRDRALEQGYFGLAEWLAKAEAEWAAKASRDERGQLRIPNALANLDYRRKLSRQSPNTTYKVLYNKSGTNLCSGVISGINLQPAIHDAGLELSNGFIADHETYVFETNSQGEAYFLSAVFNSPTLDGLIKSSQTRGLFGERDIHTRPLQLPIPKYEESNDTHLRLAELGQACHELAAEALPELAARYRSTGKIRGEVRRLLADQLTEIDGLVKGLLGLDNGKDSAI